MPLHRSRWPAGLGPVTHRREARGAVCDRAGHHSRTGSPAIQCWAACGRRSRGKVIVDNHSSSNRYSPGRRHDIRARCGQGFRVVPATRRWSVALCRAGRAGPVGRSPCWLTSGRWFQRLPPRRHGHELRRPVRVVDRRPALRRRPVQCGTLRGGLPSCRSVGFSAWRCWLEPPAAVRCKVTAGRI